MKSTDAATNLQDSAIAVIGMAGRFPRSRDLREYWDNLREGRECISFFSESELLADGADRDMLARPEFVASAGTLDDADLFDAALFGYSARDAELIDPQQRVLLECAWHALEDAGCDPMRYRGAIAVFAGGSLSTYLLNLLSHPEIGGSAMSLQVLLGNDKDHLATRIAYKLNLRGPAISVQTACSTSLVAVCLAHQSLLDHQCDIALAGGVRIRFPQRCGYLYQEGMISSRDGHCRPFDAQASGTIGGNGVGLVVLKRLRDALADGDAIRGLILGAALNNDGSHKVGYTAPSVEGQAAVIAAAQAAAGVDADSISYIEAHGTATPLGDPIEVAALSQAFHLQTARRQFCAIGSVKSNLGHLDSAAGVASLIKTVLMLEHREIAPSLHFEAANPQIDFARSAFRVAARREPWENGAIPRRAGVSSFGMGGTNAHVVLEEWSQEETAEEEDDARLPQLLPLSANSGAALATLAGNLREDLAANPGRKLRDVAWTLQVGRHELQYRAYVLATSVPLAGAALAGKLRSRRIHSSGEPPPVVFMFPGQGSQFAGMGRALYESFAVYRAAVDECARHLSSVAGLNVLDVMFADPQSPERRQVDETRFSQPALFIVSYALAQLWSSLGVRPAAMIGHSVGEFVAACLAGVMSWQDALLLVAERGRLMQSMPRGAMLSIAAEEEDVLRMLGEFGLAEGLFRSNGKAGLALAAVNSPGLCVVSGQSEQIEAFRIETARQSVGSTLLHTSHAFHSHMMDGALEPFSAVVSRIPLRAPTIPYVSNVTGDWVKAAETSKATYWACHMRQTVRFAAGVAKILDIPRAVFVECGPGDTLCTLVRAAHSSAPPVVLGSIPRSSKGSRDEGAQLATAVGELWSLGLAVDWSGLHAARPKRRLRLPLYPFERQRYWVDPVRAPTTPARTTAVADGSRSPAILPREPFHNWFYRPQWREIRDASTSSGSERADNEQWLVFANAGARGDTLIGRLRERASLTIVRAGRRYSVLGENELEIDPRDPEHYRQLFALLRSEHREPQRIVHAWTAFGPDQHRLTVAEFQQLQTLGAGSLLMLLQELHRSSAPARANMTVLSRKAFNVLEREAPHSAHATLVGVLRTAPQENPSVRFRHIDLGADADQGVTDEVIAELLRSDAGPVTALRHGRRYVPQFERVEARPPNAGIATLPKGGVWLITGGLGRIGMAMAELLITLSAAKVALVTHSELPPEEEWESYLREARGEMTRRIAGIRALQALGQPLAVIRADIGDEDGARLVVRQARERLGDIAGIIHCAAETSPDAFVELQNSDAELARRHLHPKVHGILALERALTLEQQREPEIIVLMSSLAALLGGLTMGTYAAANAALDAVASNHPAAPPVGPTAADGAESGTPAQARTTRWISINWDGWTFGSPEEKPLSLTPLEGLHAFLSVLAAPYSQVAVATTDLEMRFRHWVGAPLVLQPKAGDDAQESPLLSDRHPRPDLANAYIAPRDDIERALAELWQELFALESVGRDDNFFELGGHSLLAVQLASRIHDRLGIEVTVARVLEFPTVGALAAELQEDIAQLERQLDVVEQMVPHDAPLPDRSVDRPPPAM